MFLFFIHSFHILSEKTPLYMSNTVALIRIVNSICRFVRSVRIDNLLYAPCAACISLSHQECISLLRQCTCTVCRFVRSVRIVQIDSFVYAPYAEFTRSVHLITCTPGVYLKKPAERLYISYLVLWFKTENLVFSKLVSCTINESYASLSSENNASINNTRAVKKRQKEYILHNSFFKRETKNLAFSKLVSITVISFFIERK